MKLMTFNILWGGIDKYRSRIDFIKKVIREVSPDFLALQEVDNFEKDNNKLLKELSQDSGLQYYALSHGPIQGNGERYKYSVASLSRYPLEKKHAFSDSPLQYAALSTVIDSPLGELSVCNVHLNLGEYRWNNGSQMWEMKPGKSGKGLENKRLEELEIILKHVSGYKNQILLGDFNSVSADDNYDLATLEMEHRFDVVKLLQQDHVDTALHLGLANRSTYPTLVNKNPDFIRSVRIDYIFVSRSLAAHIKKASVIKTPVSKQASDHYPFVVTLE